MRLVKKLIAARSRFTADQRGVVALMFGLMILPMLGAVGLAIDFGTVMTARTKAQMAADAAALQASGVTRDLLKNSDGSTTSTDNAIADGKKRGESLFAAHASQAGLGEYDLILTVTRTGQTIESRASFSVETRTFIGKVFGRNTFTAVGEAIATSSLPTYVDVYVLMDVSQSMGLAATIPEAVKLFNITGCVFGCHVRREGDKIPLEQVAHNNSIRLRIDVLRDAVTKMITDAETDSNGDSVYRFGLYTMSLDAGLTNHSLNEISKMTGNFSTLKVNAQAIDLSANNTKDGLGDSHLNTQIDALQAKVTRSGDGSTQAKAKVYVFIVTDGLRDYRVSGPANQHTTGPIDSSKCDYYKSSTMGITVGVLYTTYLPIYKDPNKPSAGEESNYVGLVRPHKDTIAPALKNCASKDWFFEASDDAGIRSAIDKMFAQTSNAPSLTQ